jgi:hypothetical protein
LNNIEVVQDSDSLTLLVAPIKVQSSAWNSGTSCLLNITLSVCVCVKQAVSVFVLSLYTRHKQAHDANQQKPAAHASVTIYICFGQWDELTLLGSGQEREREREIVTRFRVQTYFCVGYQISINFKMAKYISIRAFRRQSTYTFVLSECRESVCISCFQF